MLVYFLRHGETIWNREGRIQGQTPHVDLTAFGVRLAELTREGLARRHIRFDHAFTSPLRRASHTAEIVLKGQECPLSPDIRLQEMGFGPYEGTCIGDGRWVDENIRIKFIDPARYHPPAGAESFDDVTTRLSNFLASEIIPLEGRCETVLVVTHGGIMRTLLRLLLKTPLECFWEGRQPNCCVHLVACEKGALSLVERSAVFYDPDLAATVPSV